MVVIFIPNSEKVTSRIDFIRRNADEMNLHLTFYAYMYLDPSLSEKIAPELFYVSCAFFARDKNGCEVHEHIQHYDLIRNLFFEDM